MPLATGRACAEPPTLASTSPAFFAPVQCIGAFASPHPQSNWLAGWSLLFPEVLGASVFTAISATLPSDAQSTQFTIDTTSISLSPLDTLPARRRMNGGAINPIYRAEQCEGTGFSGVGSPIWVRLAVQQPAVLWLSTCSRQEGEGFDTDLAVFEVAGGGRLERIDQLEQLACNGDGFGEQGCQPLYSRLSFFAEIATSYFVAIGGYDSSLGSNVTLTASFLQAEISFGPSDVPIVITLDGLSDVNATIFVPSPKRVVILGINATAPAVLRGQGMRLFEVEGGASLYLSNLHLRDGGVEGGCGGAVIVRAGGALVAQFVRFENNSAGEGGAICMDSHGDLNLTAVTMSGNSASSSGYDIHLGRPAASFPRINLQGVTLGNEIGESGGVGRRLAQQAGAISSAGLWVTASCAAGENCLFSIDEPIPTPTYSTCQPTRLGGRGGDGEVYGRTCSCAEDSGLPVFASPEELATAPYGESSLSRLAGRVSRVCRPILQLEVAAEYTSFAYALELRKTAAISEEVTINISVLLNLRAAEWWVDQPFNWSVTPQLEAGVRSAASCLLGGVDDGTTSSTGAGLCVIEPDGTITVSDANATKDVVSGTPVKVYNASGSLLSTALNGGSVLNLPLTLSSSQLRETSQSSPYTHTLAVAVEQRTSHSPRLLQIDVAVSVAIDASKCTFYDTTLGTDLILGVNSSYNLQPAVVGISENFFITLRDIDGLPIVRELYEGVQRVELLSVQLQRLDDNSSKPVELPTTFIGSQSRVTAGANGRVQVDVLLNHAGEHLIRLFALPGPSSTTPVEFSWTVGVSGECLPDQVQVEGGTCRCRAGWYRVEDDAECSVCPPETFKEETGNSVCTPCIDALQDPLRTATLGSVAAYHDELTDCGCASGWFLGVNSISPRQVAQLCPPSYDTASWDSRVELQSYREACCGFGGLLNCSGREEYQCAERQCKELKLPPLLQAAKQLANTSSCTKCDIDSMACNQTNVAIDNLPIRPGFWRVNELSTTLLICRGGACIGSESIRGQFAEELCASGHSGPLCAVCLPQHYQTTRGSCLPCSQSTIANLYLDQPDVVHTVILVIVLCFLCVGACLARCIYVRRNQTRGIFGFLRWAVLYTASHKEVFASKIAILASMLQVQLAVIPAFEIIYPSDFEVTLDEASFWEFNLPLDCLFELDFYTRLFYMTLIPLITAVLLLVLAMVGRVLSDRDLQLSLYLRQPEDLELRFARLKHMSFLVASFSWPVCFTPQGVWAIYAANQIREYVGYCQRSSQFPPLEASPLEERRWGGDNPHQMPFGRVPTPPAIKRLLRSANRFISLSVVCALLCFAFAIYGLSGGLGGMLLNALIALAGAVLLLHALMLALFAHVVRGHIKASNRRRALSTRLHSNRNYGRVAMQLSLQAIFLLLFFLYPEVSSLIFSTFSCDSFGDGTRYLKRDLSINCDSDQHVLWQAYAGVMVCVYPVGVPCVYAVMLWLYHQQLTRVRRVQQLLVERSHDSSVNDPHALGLDMKRKVVKPAAAESKGGLEGNPADRMETEEASGAAVVLYSRDETEEGEGEGEREDSEPLGLYEREGTWAGLPAFRHTERPELWLVTCVHRGHSHWIVQRAAQRGGIRGLLSVSKPQALHASARWKRFRDGHWVYRSSLGARLVDSSELTLWKSAGVLLYVARGGDGGEAARLGVYLRDGTFASRPCFRHAEHPELYLCANEEIQSWLVQTWNQRGSEQGYLSVAAARSPLESVRWKQSVLIKKKIARGRGFHAFEHRWEYWQELRCRAVDERQIKLLHSLSESSDILGALRNAEVTLSIALEQSMHPASRRRASATPRASAVTPLESAVAPRPPPITPRESSMTLHEAVTPCENVANRDAVTQRETIISPGEAPVTAGEHGSLRGRGVEGRGLETTGQESCLTLQAAESFAPGVQARRASFAEPPVMKGGVKGREEGAKRPKRDGSSKRRRKRSEEEPPDPVGTPSFRKRAHGIFRIWHQRLGIELDPDSELAV
ncbi:MAG: hypothetical protein SGPRY_005480, partial [Prymnesium sp.]